MIYFTSDQHFYHAKTPRVGDRVFTSVEEKNAFLIKQWNDTVSPEDTIYILGDLSEGTAKQTEECLHTLNGTKYLIIGNHDRYLDEDSFDQSLFGWVKQYYELHALNTKFVLFHYPIEEWSGYNKDRIHVHGHLHSRTAIHKPIRRYEVGVDAHDGKPVSIEEVWQAVSKLHNRN